MKFRFTAAIIFAVLILFAGQNTVLSQEISGVRIDDPVKIDGILDEEIWSEIEGVTGFGQYKPAFGDPASQKTVVKIAYDDYQLYIGFKCFDSDPDLISRRITRRDGAVNDDDAVGIIIDPFSDGSNAYMFISNVLGTQQDEQWTDNGRTRDGKWDATWYSAGSINQDGWTMEIAIPFTILKFNRDATQWRINMVRTIPRNLEWSFWKSDLTEFFRVSEYGSLTGLELENAVTKKYTFIPYIQSQVEKGAETDVDGGLDFRYSLSSNMSLEATFNPDFATIEADVEQVNMTRYELSYPEKRPFFLEGAENYQTRIRQFYSRRIGEIPWGVKFNGKTEQWKFNMLNTQSDPGTASANIEEGRDAYYSVFRLDRSLQNNSNIGIIGANRNYDDQNKGSVGLVSTMFFTDVLGMTSQLIRSYGGHGDGAWTGFIRPSYDSKFTHFHVRYTHIGENVRENMNDTGFIRDDDRQEFDTNFRRNIWINKYGIDQLLPSVNYNRYYSNSGTLRSWNLSNDFEIYFLKRWVLDMTYEEEYKLFEKAFRNTVYEVDLEYDNNRGFGFVLTYVSGVNYDSDFEQYEVEVDFQIKEGWNVSYSAERTWFYPDTDEDNSIIHYLRSTYYMDKDLFLKLFFQSRYNTVGGAFDPKLDLDRETVQAVFVWRFLPPFGSLQIAYQQGTTRVTETTGYGKTLFTKLSWVF